ncbi:hypothetical protein ACIOHE_26515 [Streptomyces sp. NPDC087851]|uniref:hypothetical protein n=1 Tax=Streptomyces sp. NPDC087851 TaxID=3365810 RepID=UPI0038023E0D
MEIVRDELTPAGSRFRLPSEPGIVTVTPEMASDWLSYRNHPKNRPLSKAVSFKYQKDMEAGRWTEETPEGYIFDTDGWIISGQHRMKAQANSNVTLRMWVFPGEPREIFEVVDQGYKRTAAHLLRVPNATSIANGGRHLAALADGDRWGMPRFSKITTPEIVETVHAWPELTWHVTAAHATSVQAGIPAGAHCAMLAQAARAGGERSTDLIQMWLDGVRTGADLAARDPRLHLRRRFHSGPPTGKGARDLTYALIVKAWNAYVAGETITVLRHMSTEVLPRVTGFDFERKSA